MEKKIFENDAQYSFQEARVCLVSWLKISKERNQNRHPHCKFSLVGHNVTIEKKKPKSLPHCQITFKAINQDFYKVHQFLNVARGLSKENLPRIIIKKIYSDKKIFSILFFSNKVNKKIGHNFPLTPLLSSHNRPKHRQKKYKKSLIQMPAK